MAVEEEGGGATAMPNASVGQGQCGEGGHGLRFHRMIDSFTQPAVRSSVKSAANNVGNGARMVRGQRHLLKIATQGKPLVCLVVDTPLGPSHESLAGTC